jgi:hypothetical protein
MKKKVVSIFCALVASILLTTTAWAGTAVKLSSVTFSLGSLIADGKLSGLGKTDVTVKLDAIGTPDITCINFGGNTVPGQSSPKISASGEQALLGNDPVRKNGSSRFGVETQDPDYLPWDVAGCPSANWIGHIDFIRWTNATISINDTASGILLLKKDYTCTTTRYPASVSCTPVP